MAFSYTVTDIKHIGRNFLVSWGTWTNGSGDSGGAIATGLSNCVFFSPTCGSHLGSESVKVTRSGGTATIVTSTDADGDWFAFGY